MRHNGPKVRLSSGADTTASTPSAAAMISLLGGFRHDSVCLSNDELKRIRNMYGFDNIKSNSLTEAGFIS